MTRVRFSSQQLRYTDGDAEWQVDVQDFRDLRRALLARYPTLPGAMLDGQLIAVDGEIINRPLLQSLRGAQEVIFVGRMTAG